LAVQSEGRLGIRKTTDYDFSGKAMRRVISNLKLQNRVIPFREAFGKF
jgi:hypothetical protein